MSYFNNVCTLNKHRYYALVVDISNAALLKNFPLLTIFNITSESVVTDVPRDSCRYDF